jgi:Protein of unknown function (DUF3313)
MRSDRYARIAIAVITLAALAVVGCGILKPTRGRHFEDAEHSGFLGDYSQLKPREGYQAQEVYVDTKANWKSYSAVYIQSVTMYVSDASKKPSAEEQKMLTDMLYKSLHDKVAEKFKIADKAGPGVLELRAALTQTKGARVLLNTVTTVVPQLRTASAVAGLGTDTAALVGTASMEGELTDSASGERLAAVVDSRAGTKGVLRMLSKWADVQAICDHWGERTRDFLVAQGVQQKQ